MEANKQDLGKMNFPHLQFKKHFNKTIFKSKLKRKENEKKTITENMENLKRQQKQVKHFDVCNKWRWTKHSNRKDMSNS